MNTHTSIDIVEQSMLNSHQAKARLAMLATRTAFMDGFWRSQSTRTNT